jgi:hypothetical protein
MDEEYRMSGPLLFARWAGEDFQSWYQAIGVSVTHLSRGNGRVTNVSQEGGTVFVHVQYAKEGRVHALWEFRTELTHMSLPDGLTRDDMITPVRARRLLQEQATKADSAALTPEQRRERYYIRR